MPASRSGNLRLPGTLKEFVRHLRCLTNIQQRTATSGLAGGDSWESRINPRMTRMARRKDMKQGWEWCVSWLAEMVVSEDFFHRFCRVRQLTGASRTLRQFGPAAKRAFHRLRISGKQHVGGDEQIGSEGVSSATDTNYTNGKAVMVHRRHRGN